MITSPRQKRYFPSRTKLKSCINDHKNILLPDTNFPLDEIKKKRNTHLKNMKVITDRCYAKAKETQQLVFKDLSFISFTRNFKYLGS